MKKVDLADSEKRGLENQIEQFERGKKVNLELIKNLEVEREELEKKLI